MDALGGLLDGARARGALFHQTVLDPPWSLRIDDGAALALVTMPRGAAWIMPDDAAALHITAGDVAIARGPAPYTVADDPSREPQLVIRSGDRAVTPDGVDVTAQLREGVRTCSLSADGSAVLLSATYPVRHDVSERLLAALPQVLVVPARDTSKPLMDMIVAEATRDDPGQQTVLDRLLDLALIATLRAWFARPEAEAPGWYTAQADPVVGPVLQLMHDDPAHAWTVASLAAKAGVSRAVFARRFADLVGEPPMSYLTSWRIALAADLLRETDATVEAIAGQVGYSNAFALSVAFKRVRGSTPSEHRTGEYVAG